MTDPEVIRARANDARAMLENEGVMGGLKRLSERLIFDWRTASRSAPSLRDELHAQVAAIDAVAALWRRDIEDADFLDAQEAKAAKQRR